jgi:hypothetical protein
MCTVTFIPGRNRIILTSSRDEKLAREKAIPPALYKRSGYSLVYPRDTAGGGSWIAMKENGDAAVLLNGAFMPHTPVPPYRASRGLVFLDILDDDRPSLQLAKTDLGCIEPFTVVLWENNSLYEFRWDGNERYCKQLPAHQPFIWSSATLYDAGTVKKREQWFSSFLNHHPEPDRQEVMHFHRFTGDGDSSNDLLMSRDGVYSTVSITSMLLTPDYGSMQYLDVQEDHITEKKIGFIPAAAPV